MKSVLSAALAALLLMMTAAVCAAQMDYETLSPHLTYTHLGDADMPLLMAPGEVIGGADGVTSVSSDQRACASGSGPATPVTDTAMSAPVMRRAPSAMARAVSADTAPCSSSSGWGTPSTSAFTSVQ